MTTNRSKDYLVGLVRELCKLPQETEWVEFKENDAEPENIGEYLSALANSAALAGKAFAYKVWGIRDSDHAIVGTSFSPLARKVTLVWKLAATSAPRSAVPASVREQPAIIKNGVAKIRSNFS